MADFKTLAAQYKDELLSAIFSSPPVWAVWR